MIKVGFLYIHNLSKATDLFVLEDSAKVILSQLNLDYVEKPKDAADFFYHI